MDNASEGFEKTQVARSLGFGCAPVTMAAQVGGERVRLVDGHARASAALTVLAAVDVITPDGKTIALDL